MDIDLTPYYAQPKGKLPFVDRHVTMPVRNHQMLAPEQIQQEWQLLVQQTLPPAKRLLYVHIPFCATHCSFCGFYQNKLLKDSTQQYCEYLLKEIEMDANSPLYQSAPIHAIYFGGGTPSALSANELFTIISTLKKRLPLAPDCEITIEGRVLNFDDERIDACLEAGANRFSIGIQTFDSKIRKRLARTSDRQQAIHFLENVCSRDKAAVVCDLIFGLPGQTEKHWREDLAIVNDLPLDGVDLYALNLLSTTPLRKSVENNRITLPDVSERRQLYQIGATYLLEQGWHQLSNSHWGKTTRERNLYNLLIKQGADYLALGSCAGGNLNGRAYMIERDLARYYEILDQGKKPIMMLSPKSKRETWKVQVQAGIEAGRLDLSKIVDDVSPLQPLLDQWHASGLTQDNGYCLRLTLDGRFWASNLLKALQQLLTQFKSTEHTITVSK